MRTGIRTEALTPGELAEVSQSIVKKTQLSYSILLAQSIYVMEIDN